MQFATTPGGVQIAWASIGEGPPVLKAPNWLNHLEYEWRSPVWGPAFAELDEYEAFEGVRLKSVLTLLLRLVFFTS